MAHSATAPIVFSPSGAARALGISRRHVQRACASGALTFSKIGVRRLITREALLAWVKSHHVKVTP